MHAANAPRSLLRRLPLTAAASLLIWFAMGATTWNRGVAAATEAFLRLVETPTATQLFWENDTVVIHRSDSPEDQDPGYRDLPGITFNTPILLALIWATPRKKGFSKLVPAVLAFLALFLSHIAHFSLAIQTIYATQLEWCAPSYASWQREVLATGRYFFDIALKYALPFVFWALFLLIPRLLSHRDENDP